MAGDWLKIECCLPEKPEVFQIAGTLGMTPEEAFGRLFKVWRWFDAHTESGNAHSVSYALVDHVAGVSGFAEAMAFAGWLTQEGRDLAIPNFSRHNGKTAKNRALTAKRVAKHEVKTNAVPNAPSVSGALAREEKRREEEDQEQGADAPAPKKSRKRQELTFTQWDESLGDAEAIPADDPIFDYADRVGLPREYIALEWAWFEAKYSGPDKGKRYADWRQHFRNAVEGGWGNLWRVNQAGEYYLTTQGIQAQRALA